MSDDNGQMNLPAARSPHTMARNVDPTSSHDAAGGVTRSGVTRIQRLACLELVRCNPGLTSREIDTAGGLVDVAHRRLPELREERRVYSVQVDGKGKQRWFVESYRFAVQPHDIVRHGPQYVPGLAANRRLMAENESLRAKVKQLRAALERNP